MSKRMFFLFFQKSGFVIYTVVVLSTYMDKQPSASSRKTLWNSGRGELYFLLSIYRNTCFGFLYGYMNTDD
jgi:hypothetical protein